MSVRNRIPGFTNLPQLISEQRTPAGQPFRHMFTIT